MTITNILDNPLQVLDRNCKGVGGATVEVWYAGWSTGKLLMRAARDNYFGIQIVCIVYLFSNIDLDLINKYLEI